MTKTEQALITRAISHPISRRSGVMVGYRTGTKRGAYGGRESRALGKLVRAGIARIVSQQSYVDSRSAYSDHYTETVYEVAFPIVRA